MGRPSTYPFCTFEALRLEMSHLSAIGLKDNVKAARLIGWTNGNKISIHWDTTLEFAYVQLVYTLTMVDGTKHERDYKIGITRQPSNLGKGHRLYFICPVSHKLATILYSCYGSKYFKHRNAYQNRIYYEQQMESKRYRRAFKEAIERRIHKLESQRHQTHYNGQLTKRAKKLNELNQKLWDLERVFDRMLTGNT